MIAKRFRKKPVEVEAILYTRESCHEVHRFMGVEHAGDCSTAEIDIPTPEGDMVAREGTWIVRGVEGEFYPVKSSIFDKTYEPLEG